jgi:hypothetical protein
MRGYRYLCTNLNKYTMIDPYVQLKSYLYNKITDTLNSIALNSAKLLILIINNSDLFRVEPMNSQLFFSTIVSFKVGEDKSVA